jgi:acetyl esterase
VVYFHGGGWVLGGLDSIDRTCRLLADGADLTVVNVDYRLAPEHPFPAAFDDALAVTRWAVDGGGDLGIDGARVGVAGDSAGGNLAAAVALACRSAVAAQLLVYPAVDATMSSASAQSYVEGPGLVADEMRWFYEQYAPGVPRDEWRLSPLLAPDLTGAPPALVITAEHDPLRDEGESYALALAEAGVDATSVRYQGVTHGFFGWGAVIAPGATATAQAIDWLSQRLRSGHRGHGPRSRQGVA